MPINSVERFRELAGLWGGGRQPLRRTRIHATSAAASPIGHQQHGGQHGEVHADSRVVPADVGGGVLDDAERRGAARCDEHAEEEREAARPR